MSLQSERLNCRGASYRGFMGFLAKCELNQKVKHETISLAKFVHHSKDVQIKHTDHF